MAEPQIPQAFEEAVEEKTGLRQDPVLGVGTEIVKDETIPEAAREDVQVQQEGIDFRDVLAGNVSKVGSLNVTPKLLEAAKKNPAIMRRLKAQHAIAGQATSEDQPIIPVMRTGEFVPPPEIISDPTLLEKTERIAMGRKAVDDLLVQQGVDNPVVRQVFVDDFATGNFYESLSTRLAQAGQFTVAALPMAGILGYNAIGAYYDSKAKGTDWSAEWGSRQNQIQQSFKTTYDAISGVIPNATMAIAFNNHIEEELNKKLEAGQITQEQYDQTMFITDDEGNKVRRDFVSEDQAQSMIDLAFTELPTLEKFGVIFVETAAGMAGPGSAKGVLAMQKYNRLLKKYDETTDIGQAIAGKTDPLEVVNIVESMGVKTRINRNALSIGVMQQRTDRALDTLTDQIAEAGQKLDALRIQGVPKGSTQYKVAQGEYQNLTSRMLRAKYTAKVYPYIKETTQDALVISAGQLAAREWLPEATGLSPETSEVVGAITMIAGGHQLTQSIGGKLVKMTAAPRGGAPRVFATSMDFMANVLTLGSLRLANVKLTDDTIKNFELATGRTLTGDEIKGINATVKMMNSLGDTEREVVMGAIDEYVGLRDRIVNSFPEADREEASELFNMSFSNAAGLNFMSAVTSVNANRLDVRELGKMELSSIYKQMNAANRQVEITETALANLERKMKGSDIQNPEIITEFIASNRQALKSFKDSQVKTAEEQLALLGDIRKTVLADPTIDLPEGFILDLTEADEALRTQLGETIDKGTQIKEVMTDLFTGLNKRLETMRGYRGRGKEYYRDLGRTTEDVIDTQIDSIWTSGHAAYDKVRKASQGQPGIDLTEAVEYMVNEAAPGTAFDRFFSPEGQFFSGRLGRQNMFVFNDMVSRAIPDIDELRDVLKTGGVDQALVDGMTNIELAMELKRIQPDFNPFSQANAYEVDVLKRAFTDYAYKVDNGALAETYRTYGQTLDNAIRQQQPEVFNLLQQARTTYRSEVGDRLRPGGFLHKIDVSRQGGRIVTATGDDMFQYAYKNVNPLNLFKGVTNNISKALKGNFDAEGEIAAEMGAIVTQFADTVDGKRMFDLTTDAGRAKFAALQSAVGEKVFADWADNQIKVFERVGSIDAVKQGGYKLDNLADMDSVHSLLQVPVKTNDGVVMKPLVNLSELYADHRNLDEFVRGSEKARKEYASFISDFNNVDSKLRTNIQNNIRIQDDALDELKPFTGGLNADAFYQRFIIDSSPAEIENLRNMFVNAQRKAGKSADDASKMFDSAVGRLVAKGFQNRGGLVPIPEAVLPATRRDVPVARQFATPENMLSDIRDHRDKLVNVLGEDHVGYLEDIGKFLARSKDASIRLDGMTSGYSLNEGLSRLYNISRGMVSPLYVTSEFAVRLAARSNIDVLELAAGNRDAADIIHKMFKTPELVTQPEMKTLNAAISEFVFTEMARRDMFAPELNEMFLLPEKEETDDEQ